MKKRFLSVFLALALCLGLLPTTAQAAWATINVGEIRKLTCSSSGSNYVWSVTNNSILDYKGNGSSCTIKGKQAGSAIVEVSYDIQIEGPAMVNGRYTIQRRTETQFEQWSIVVKDPSAPTPPAPATIPTPSVVYGSVGDDVSGIITGIKGFSCGVVPVKYRDKWGFADADMKLVIPFQFDDSYWYNRINDYGFVNVKADGKQYVINTKGEVVYAHSQSSNNDLVSCDSAYIWVKRVYDKRAGIFSNEYYDFQGEQISYSKAYDLETDLFQRRAELGDLEHYRDEGGFACFGPPTREYYSAAPTHRLRMEGNGRELNRDVEYIQEGLLVVYDAETKLFGALDLKGNLVIPLQYDALYSSRDGYLAYQKDSKFGLLKNPVNPPSGQAVKPDASKPNTSEPSQTASNPDFIIENGVLTRYRGSGGDVVIPSSVTSIGEDAFFNCTGLTSVTFPSGITSIGDWAFYGCTGLTSVTIPDGVTTIGRYVFSRCSGLTSVTVPGNVTSIESSAFSKCTGLTSITIPASVTSIKLFAFDGCTALKNVYYAGTRAQWKAVSIGSFNAPLKSAVIHYK